MSNPESMSPLNTPLCLQHGEAIAKIDNKIDHLTSVVTSLASTLRDVDAAIFRSNGQPSIKAQVMSNKERLDHVDKELDVIEGKLDRLQETMNRIKILLAVAFGSGALGGGVAVSIAKHVLIGG